MNIGRGLYSTRLLHANVYRILAAAAAVVVVAEDAQSWVAVFVGGAADARSSRLAGRKLRTQNDSSRCGSTIAATRAANLKRRSRHRDAVATSTTLSWFARAPPQVA